MSRELIPDLISVIMGIYNCEKTLSKAIESILNQSYTNWELIMCDDGSVDNTYAIAQEYQKKYPQKIVLIKNESNQGLNITLNNCIKKVRGEYIARQDGDDWSLPDRFEKELQFLKKYPQCSFVSTSMIVNNGEKDIAVRSNDAPFPTKDGFMKSNQFFHATVIIRTEAMLAVDGYSVDKRLLRLEDYNLWTKLYAAGYQGCNMEEALYVVLEDEAAYSRRNFQNRLNEAYAKKLAIKLLGLSKTNYVYVVYAVMKGFVPPFLYKIIHTRRTIQHSKGPAHSEPEQN